jgi:hypothetical protein
VLGRFFNDSKRSCDGVLDVSIALSVLKSRFCLVIKVYVVNFFVLTLPKCNFFCIVSFSTPKYFSVLRAMSYEKISAIQLNLCIGAMSKKTDIELVNEFWREFRFTNFSSWQCERKDTSSKHSTCQGMLEEELEHHVSPNEIPVW